MKKAVCPALALLLLVLCLLSSCSSADPAFERGELQNGTYINTTFGVSFRLKGGWNFFRDSELCEMKGIEVSGKDYDAAIRRAAKNGTAVDMAASDPLNGNAVSVSYENLRATKHRDLSNEELLSIIREDVEKAYAGFTVIPTAMGQDTLGSETYDYVRFDISNAEKTLRLVFYVRRVGDYMVIVTVTNMSGVSEAYFTRMFAAADAGESTQTAE